MRAAPEPESEGAITPWRAGVGRVVGWIRRVWRDASYRRLRRAAIVSGVIQMILAPLTSWASDTPGFVFGVLGMAYRGDPHTSNLYFNPPFAPLLQTPGFLLRSTVASPQDWMHIDLAVFPAETGTGMVSALLPDPTTLLLLKVPLIVAMLLAGVGLCLIGRGWGWTSRTTHVVGIAWLLNPLVIWATAVHGEPDVLAACLVVGALWTIQKGLSPAIAGFLLSLGFFTKIYPILLAPPMFGLLWAQSRPAVGFRPRWDVVRFAGGLALGALPMIGLFADAIGPLLNQYTPTATPQSFGGLTVLILFNHETAFLGPLWDTVLSYRTGALLHLGFVALAATTVGASLWVAIRGLRLRAPSDRLPREFIVVVVWITVAALLNYASPQPENLLATLPALILAAGLSGAVGRRAVLMLSSIGWALYLSFLTPIAFFFPAAHLLGDAPTPWMGGVVVGYHQAPFHLVADLWVVLGVAGGATLIALWCECTWRMMPAVWRDRLAGFRHRGKVGHVSD